MTCNISLRDKGLTVGPYAVTETTIRPGAVLALITFRNGDGETHHARLDLGKRVLIDHLPEIGNKTHAPALSCLTTHIIDALATTHRAAYEAEPDEIHASPPPTLS